MLSSSSAIDHSTLKRKRLEEEEKNYHQKDGINSRETQPSRKMQCDYTYQDHPEFQVLQAAWKESRPGILLPDTGNRGSGMGKFCISNDLCSSKDQQEIDVFALLLDLHKRISRQVPSGVTWGEVADEGEDPRRRRYAFLPGQRKKLSESGITIQAEGSVNKQEHNYTMSPQASIDIVWKHNGEITVTETYLECSSDTYRALEKVTNHIQELVSKTYKHFVTMENLVALQPNHHNGAKFLPAHLDFPRADGFGVVIATVCMRNIKGSSVILIDDGDEGEMPMSWNMLLKNGDCYILSGDSRNKCRHGILSEENGDRETLNLRYGLHSEEMAREEVDQYWPDNEH
jgi:hypothetical protein